MTALPDYLAELAPPVRAGAGVYGPALADRPRPYRRVARCRYCRGPFPVPLGGGRPPLYCRWHRAGRYYTRVWRGFLTAA